MNLDAPAEFANALVIHRIESPVQKPVGQFDIGDHLEESRDTDQGVYLFALIHPGNLNLEVPVDFSGSVL